MHAINFLSKVMKWVIFLIHYPRSFNADPINRIKSSDLPKLYLRRLLVFIKNIYWLKVIIKVTFAPEIFYWHGLSLPFVSLSSRGLAQQNSATHPPRRVNCKSQLVK
jgi:hypothetical protein